MKKIYFSRCLLTPKAAPVLKTINSCLSTSIRFQTVLDGTSWYIEGKNLKHPNNDSLKLHYTRFADHANFLIKGEGILLHYKTYNDCCIVSPRSGVG